MKIQQATGFTLSSGAKYAGLRAIPPQRPLKPAETTIELPLGGCASTDPEKVRMPVLRPLWILATMLMAVMGLYVWIRLTWLAW